jgi:hypothetical protein
VIAVVVYALAHLRVPNGPWRRFSAEQDVPMVRAASKWLEA